MKDQGLGSWVTRRARMSPASTALIDGDAATTYAELDRRVTALAHGLRRLGVQRGDRVAYLGFNGAGFVETLFAVAKLGAVFFPVNTRLAAPELRHVLADSGSRLLLHQESFSAAVAAAHVDDMDLQIYPLSNAPTALDPLLDPDQSPIDEAIGHDDLFMLQYTSGTSGRPKGVMLTHGNVIWNVLNLLVDVDLGSSEVALVTAPMFHTAALNQVLLPVILKGGTCLLEAKFDPARAIDVIANRGVTMLFGVTSMYQALAEEPTFGTADLHTLRHALSGGAPIPETLLRTYVDRELRITQGYGLTETSPGATMLREADGLRKLGSAGTSCFFSDVQVVDLDGRPAAVGEPGEVLVQGPNVSPGYWRNETATDAAFHEGWIHTGDVAVVDDDGFVYIVDRLKDMYISGGENVYPAEVERAIYEHPDILECAVIGLSDPQWGEVGRAFVRVRSGSSLDHEQLLAFLAERIARYKLPRSTVIRDELPRNASGKLQRSKLKEL
ncbi:acyl-CoA synthetase [Gordonia sp. SL306]|uniref:acyl-CoA synthetase n=1 Tax=Gordonia sp. SL306 TaxID=2995145 RepID=UPI00226EBCF6|nr:long-chain fatty acid--CoA ligase [Gordonia sp. SL306]WAC54549.1 long-chain fatty acid--CoA ligase [Gordonia sp. SL306]